MTFYIYTCNECKTHGVELHSITRYGGGSYNRPPRSYSASVCRFCIGEMAHTINNPEPGKAGYRSSELIWGYRVGTVQYAYERIVSTREALGDFEFGANDANAYWGDYKRLNKLMAERIENETEEYLKGFHSVER